MAAVADEPADAAYAAVEPVVSPDEPLADSDADADEPQAPYLDHLAALTPEELRAIIKQQQGTIEWWQARGNHHRVAKKRLKDSLDKERQHTATALASLKQATFTVQPKRIRSKQECKGYSRTLQQHSRILTPLGGYRLALKRSLGHAGSTDMLDQQQVTSTRQTIAVWEAKLAASLILSSRDFYADSEAVIRKYHRHRADAAMSASDAASHSPNDVVASWEFHRIMGDATNCTATKHLKAHVVQVRSLFRVAADAADDDDEGTEAWTCTIMPDLAAVPSSCRGIHTRALYFHQMSNVGTPTWLLTPSYDGLHIRLFLFITDAGPDQKECILIVAKECCGDPLTLIWHDFCVLHQMNLIVKKTLEQGGAEYLRKLATLTNTWRSAGTAFSIRKEWLHRFGEADMARCVSNLPQRPLKGRWGYVSKCEEFFLNLTNASGQGHTKLNAVGLALWTGGDDTKHPKRRKAKAKPVVEAALDGLLPGEDNYSDTLGRWVRESLALTADLRWWSDLYVQHFSRQPIAHAINSVQQNNRMFNFVCNIAPTIKHELDASMTTSCASTWLDPALALLPHAAHPDVIRQAACTCTAVGADFHRRIILPCGALPRKLVWIVSVHQGVYSDVVLAVAREVVTLSRDGNADVFTGKLCCLFQREFNECATSGITPQSLYRFIDDLTDEWIVDSQRVEGVNSWLKKQMKVAPHISPKLLSARTCIKTMFPAVATTKQAVARTHLDNLRRWEALESVASTASARHANTAFKERLDAFVGDGSRWSVLDSADVPLDEYAPMPPRAALTGQQRTSASALAVNQHFAAEMLVALKDMMDHGGTPWLPSAKVAFELLWVSAPNADAPDEPDSSLAEYWMPANTYYNQLWMVKCDTVVGEDTLHNTHTHTHTHTCTQTLNRN